MSDPIMLQQQDVEIGDKVIYGGKVLIVDTLYTQGADAKNANLLYAMVCPKGVYGLKEPE